MIFSLSLQRLSCSRKSYHWWQVGITTSVVTLLLYDSTNDGDIIPGRAQLVEREVLPE